MNPLTVRKSLSTVIFQNKNYYTPCELYRFCHLELSTSFSLPNIVESRYEEKLSIHPKTHENPCIEF